MDAIEILNHLAVGDQVVSNIMPSEEWMTGDRGIAMDRYKSGVSTSQRRHKPTYIILVHENYISVALQGIVRTVYILWRQYTDFIKYTYSSHFPPWARQQNGGVSAASIVGDNGYVSNQNGPGIDTCNTRQRTKRRQYEQPTSLTIFEPNLHHFRPLLLPVYVDLARTRMKVKRMHALDNDNA